MLDPDSCAQSLTRRILGGAGTLSLVPFDVDATWAIPMATHGFDRSGQLVVACHVDDVAELSDGRVRIDGVKKALEVSTDITVASVHAVAHIEWQDDWFDASDLGVEFSPYLRYGVLSLDHAHLHWPCGATMVRIAELAQATSEESPVAIDEFHAREMLDSLGQRRLASLHEEVMAGVTGGMVLSDREQKLRDQWKGQVWVADIDENGVMLIGAGADRMSVTMVGFPEPVRDMVNLATAVQALARQ